MIKAIIIDDEEKAHKIIRQIISKHFKNIEIVASAKNVKEGIETINKHLPHFVFLDINMPDGTGFDLLNKLNYYDFKLIIVTSYEEYALQAIKFSAIDYILKPIDLIDFIEAVKKTLNVLKDDFDRIKIKTFLNNYDTKLNKHKKIVLKTLSDIYVVNINDIIRLEADNNYTTFYLNDGDKITISKTIKDYEKLLENYDFVRIHRSHLINLNYVEKLKKSNASFIFMKNNQKLPVSFRKKDTILKAFDNFLNS